MFENKAAMVELKYCFNSIKICPKPTTNKKLNNYHIFFPTVIDFSNRLFKLSLFTFNPIKTLKYHVKIGNATTRPLKWNQYTKTVIKIKQYQVICFEALKKFLY